MYKETINDKEGICLLTIFVIGSSAITGTGCYADGDAWLAEITGIIMSLPMIFIYSRILSLFQGRELSDILCITMGKIIGKAIAVLYIWYAFHLGTLVIRNFSEFINTVALSEVPMLVPTLFLILCCVVNVRNGIEVMARTSALLLPLIIAVVIIVELLAIPQMDFDNIKPILGNGLSPVIKGAFPVFAFPFAETVLMMGAFNSLKTKKSVYKVYFSGVFIAGVIIVMVTLRDTLILGDLLGKSYFPSHVAVSRIKIGGFLQRIEVTAAFAFVVGVFSKTSICLLVACKGIGKLFNLHDYRSIVIQTGLLMSLFSLIIYKSIMEMQDWITKVYPYYAFPFQVILPLIIWCLAEIKAKKIKPQQFTRAAK